MKICKVLNCNNKHYAKGYCNRHYTQFNKYSKIFVRTRFDKNEFRFENNICYISLYNRECNKIGETLIDKENYEQIKEYKWSLRKSDKYVTTSKYRKIFLHRMIMNFPYKMDIDHKNHNTLDNRKSNLRICTRSQNCLNGNRKSNNTSGYKGVSFDKKTNKWISQIRINGNKYNLGRFDNKIDAARTYNQAAKKYHGEFARLNRIAI